MDNKNFNIILTGVGGQGIITLVSILDSACLIEGYDIKSSELHGLSQRGGSVIIHVRFGKKINSPLISKGGADLIIGLESMEALRDADFLNSNTVFLVNNHSMPFEGHLPEKDVLESLKKIAGKNLHLVPASKICQEELQKEVLSGIYLLGYAVYKNLIPLKAESVLKAIETTIPEKYWDINIKAFNLAKNHD